MLNFNFFKKKGIRAEILSFKTLIVFALNESDINKKRTEKLNSLSVMFKFFNSIN